MFKKFRWNYNTTDIQIIDRYALWLSTKCLDTIKYFVVFTDFKGNVNGIQLENAKTFVEAIEVLSSNHGYKRDNYKNIDIVLNIADKQEKIAILDENNKIGLYIETLKKLKKTVSMLR